MTPIVASNVTMNDSTTAACSERIDEDIYASRPSLLSLLASFDTNEDEEEKEATHKDSNTHKTATTIASPPTILSQRLTQLQTAIANIQQEKAAEQSKFLIHQSHLAIELQGLQEDQAVWLEKRDKLGEKLLECHVERVQL